MPSDVASLVGKPEASGRTTSGDVQHRRSTPDGNGTRCSPTGRRPSAGARSATRTSLWGDLRPELLEAVKTDPGGDDGGRAGGRAPGGRSRTSGPTLRLDHPQRRLPPAPGDRARRDHRPRRPAPAAGPVPALVPGAARPAGRRRSTTSCARPSCAACPPARRRPSPQTLTGVPLSAAAVSRLARSLDAQVAAFHRRPVTFPARYLLVDGLWVSRSGTAPAGPSRRVVLAAYGIDAGGHRELLDYRQAAVRVGGRLGPPADLARGARARPRRGRARRSRTGPGGIAAAVAEAFPEAALQRCWTHRLRNILEALPVAERRALPARPAGDLPGPDAAGRRGRRTGAGRGPGAPAIRSSCATARARPRRAARGVRPAGAAPGQPAHDQPDRARLPRAPPPAAADRLRSPTAGQPTGSSTARCSASTSSWLAARSPYFTQES